MVSFSCRRHLGFGSEQSNAPAHLECPNPSQILEVNQQVMRRLITHVHIFSHRLANDALQFSWYVCPNGSGSLSRIETMV